jgi:hypothetical protein
LRKPTIGAARVAVPEGNLPACSRPFEQLVARPRRWQGRAGDEVRREFDQCLDRRLQQVERRADVAKVRGELVERALWDLSESFEIRLENV